MKANNVLVLLLLSLLALAQGCKQCTSVQPDPPAPVVFYFVDQQGQSLTSLQNPILHPDSIRFTLEHEPFDYLFKTPDESLNTVLYETYPVLYTKSTVNLLIHYSKEDTDTLTVGYKVNKQECYTDFTYTSYRFNGEEVRPIPGSGYLKLVKHTGS
ncbi:hypothetical protein [Pontibacter ruber]|uniref:Lipoprotein n=1 Tax=Pontibacter ruber TaxID=1343895 RepID=A0ABW5CT58_9BACT|nr:hypothetical protein [Pontibacter ruber]